MGLKDVLATNGPRYAMMALAAAKHGPQAVAQLMQGMELKAAQTHNWERQAGADARAEELHGAQMGNIQADNDRLQQAQEMEKLNAAIRLIQQSTQQQGETATDPVQAENNIMRQAQSAASLYGLPSDQLTGMVPNMTAPVTGRMKVKAKEIYDQAVKTYGEEAVANDSITLQTGEIFGDVKPSQLRAKFAAPAVDAAGAAVAPRIADPEAKTSGSFDAHFADVLAAEEARTGAPLGRAAKAELRLKAKQAYDAANDQPKADGGGAHLWVIRNGKTIRITEGQYQPGDQPASTREQGRPVTSGDAGRVADFDTSMDDLAVLRSTIGGAGSTGVRAQIGAALPPWVTDLTGWGTDAKKKQALIDRVKQVIGKTLEDGVLRKEDEAKYERILPTIKDANEIVLSKLAGLEQAVQKRKARHLEALSDAGYDTARFLTGPQAPQAPPAGATDAADPLGLFK